MRKGLFNRQINYKIVVPQPTKWQQIINILSGKPAVPPPPPPEPKELGLPEAETIYDRIGEKVDGDGKTVAIAIMETANFFGAKITIAEEAAKKIELTTNEIQNALNAKNQTTAAMEAEISRLKKKIEEAEERCEEDIDDLNRHIEKNENLIQKAKTVAGFFTV